MTGAIAHRGPDAEGFYTDPAHGVALGHRRLSILDPSPASHQPFYSDDRRYVMVYNGEVYNYRELRDQYLPGESFRTTSDTEVILRLFTRLGEDFVSLLNGMFVIAIYDSAEKSLYLYRDRAGIKPLYYTERNGTLAFASELKSLVQWTGTAPAIDKEALNLYLHLGYVPEPYSIYEGIRKFPSGHYLKKQKARTEKICYWSPEKQVQPDVKTSEAEALEELKKLVDSSVQYRMISDVPFGTFLSGGIDSSLVTAVAARHTENLSTFSIGFGESSHNEAPFAREVAKYLGTQHTEFTVTEKEALEFVPQLLSIYDEPFADSSAIPTLLVSRVARQHVKMVLTGDGGDELFMGYGAYMWAKRLSDPFTFSLRHVAANLLSAGDLRMQRAASVFRIPDRGSLPAHIFSQEQYLFSRAEIKKLVQPSWYSNPVVVPEFPSARKLSAAEKQAFFDLKYYLKDDLLVKVDRATMHYGLEARVPLLDYRIIEWSLNLDENFKRRGNTSKYLLKKLLYEYIPESYFDRPKKGFSVPLSKWLRNDLRGLVTEYLSEENVRRAGVARPEEVKRLLAQYSGGKDYLYNRVWLLLVLHMFLEK